MKKITILIIGIIFSCALFAQTSIKKENNNVKTSNGNLDIYSHNKSVYLSSNTFVRTDLTVYSMSGQVVESKRIELSNQKQELTLNNLNSGIYIIEVNDGKGTIIKKIIILINN